MHFVISKIVNSKQICFVRNKTNVDMAVKDLKESMNACLV